MHGNIFMKCHLQRLLVVALLYVSTIPLQQVVGLERVEAAGPFRCSSAPFTFPVSSGIVGWVYREDNADIERIDGHIHTGIDVFASGGDGSPIYALADGTVTRETSQSTDIYYRNQGVEGYTAHLRNISVSVGSTVIGGQTVIGYQSGDHVHVSVGVSGYNDNIIGQTRDPSPFFGANLNWDNGAREHRDWSLSIWCNTSSPPSNNSCSAPSLNSPSDGDTESSRTVNFSWQAPSDCTFSGYTFRVKDTSNMDSGGTTIVDTGESGTSHQETINGRDDQDLYWGVRAANAPNGASWATHRFRIHVASACPGPSLNNPQDGWTLPSRTVTFDWQGLSGCAFSGYTFRVKTVPDMESGGTQIIDTGDSNTSWTATFNPQWDNQDLYWGVRAANASAGAGWSVRHFRISPDSQPPTVTWTTPTGNEQTYHVTNGLVQLQVNATDNVAADHVSFNRWDAPNSRPVDLGTVFSPPYHVSIDASTLNYAWNQVNAVAYDTSGNSATHFIWLYRDQPTVTPTDTATSKPTGTATNTPTDTATATPSPLTGGYQMNVPATQAWVDTGIQVPSYPATGFIDRFDAWGTIHTPADFGPAGNMSCTAPAGWVAPGLPCYALIGRFGSDGIPFFIGPFSYSGDQNPLPHPATLYLGVNGPVSGLSGNTGSWTVNVKFNVDGYWPTDTPTSASTSVAISTGVTIISTSPHGDREAVGIAFDPSVTVQTSGFSLDCSKDFLQNQDGKLFGAWSNQGCVSLGNNQYQFLFGTPMVAPTTPGVYHSQWQIWHYPDHVGPIIDLSFVVVPNAEATTPAQSSITPTPTGTSTRVPTATSTFTTIPTNTALPSATATPTSTDVPSNTNTVQPTNTSTPIPTMTTAPVVATATQAVPTAIPPAPTTPPNPIVLPSAPTTAPMAPAATNTSLPATTNGLPTATTKPAQPPSTAVPAATPSVVTDTSGGTVAPPPSTQQHGRPPTTRAMSLPLSMSRVPQQIVSGGTTTIQIHTVPRAQITTLVQVVVQHVTFTGASAHRRRHAQTQTLYRATSHVVTDKHGQFTWKLHVTYNPAKPMPARLTITASMKGRTRTSWSMTITLTPKQHKG